MPHKADQKLTNLSPLLSYKHTLSPYLYIYIYRYACTICMLRGVERLGRLSESCSSILNILGEYCGAVDDPFPYACGAGLYCDENCTSYPAIGTEEEDCNDLDASTCPAGYLCSCIGTRYTLSQFKLIEINGSVDSRQRDSIEIDFF